MRRPAHGRFFSFFFATALTMIVLVFGAIGYLMVTSNISLSSNGINALTMVVIGASGIGALAFLTAVFFLVSRLDTRFNQNKFNSYSAETTNDEPGNYGAPRR